nr:MAG TPA: hypothetical protein [Caudoviricetes sp.]
MGIWGRMSGVWNCIAKYFLFFFFADGKGWQYQIH